MRNLNQSQKQLVATLMLAMVLSFCVRADDSKASSSRELAVSDNFTFTTYRAVTFDLTVDAGLVEMERYNKVIVSSVEPDITELDDPRLENKEHLFVARPDSLGRVYRTVSVPHFVKQLLVETQNNGTTVQQLVMLDSEESIQLALSL